MASTPSSSAPGSRKVSFSSTTSAEPTSRRDSMSPAVPRRGSYSPGGAGGGGGGGSIGGLRLRPLTQLKPERSSIKAVSPTRFAESPMSLFNPPLPANFNSPSSGTPTSAGRTEAFPPVRRMSIAANGDMSVDESRPLARSAAPPLTIVTSPTPRGTLGTLQSAHSRKGSMSVDQAFVSSPVDLYARATSSFGEGGGAIRAGGIPSFSAGSSRRQSMSATAIASGASTPGGTGALSHLQLPSSQIAPEQLNSPASARPHPYALVEPGQEVAYADSPGTATTATPVSAAASLGLGRARAHTTGGPGARPARRPSSVVGRLSGTVTPQRQTPVGARRFTIVGDEAAYGTGPTAGQVAAIHGRRFSTIAREPAASFSSTGTAPGAASHAAQRGTGVGVARGAAPPSVRSRQMSEPFLGLGRGWKDLLKGDAESLVVSLKAVLGRDGGAEAVGDLVYLLLNGGLVRAREVLYEVLKTAGRDMAPLQSAYAQVHLHELLQQLQKIAALVLNDQEWITRMSQALQGLAGLSGPEGVLGSTPPRDASVTAAYGAFLDHLKTSPVFQSAFLNLLDTLCQFVIVAEPGRDNLWQVLGDTLLSRQAHGNTVASESSDDDEELKRNPLRELFGSVCMAIEQLTGSPIRQLFRAFLEWAALADESLTDLATETHDFLSKSFVSPDGAPLVFEAHPLGYAYAPVEVGARLDAVLARWHAVALQEPHRSALQRLVRALEQTAIGIKGNSMFARCARDAQRLWSRLIQGDETGQTDRIDGALEVAKVLAHGIVAIPLGRFEAANDDVKVTLRDAVISAVDALPDEVSFNSHSRVGGGGLVKGTSLRLEGIRLVAKDLQFAYELVKAGSGAGGLGVADVSITLDVKVSFAPADDPSRSEKLTFAAGWGLPCFDGAVVRVVDSDVKFHDGGTVKDALHTLVWPLVKRAVTTRIERASQAWLSDLFTAWLPAKTPAVKRPVSLAARPTAARVPSTPGGISSPHLPQFAAFTAPGDTHGTARDRFKASVHHLTGIKMGVLEQLQNPLSEPSSPVLGPEQDAGEDLSTPADSLRHKAKRRQSMADWLTDVAKTDSTLPGHIHRPPVATNQSQTSLRDRLPSVFDEDEEGDEYETMARSLSTTARRDTTGYDTIIAPPVAPGGDAVHMLAHRGAMSSFPTGELTFDQFAAVEAAMGHEAAVEAVHGGEFAVMAGSLSELAARDATTEAAIANPPTVDQGPEVPMKRRAMSMNQVTKHLSGFADFDEDAFEDEGRPATYREGDAAYDDVPEARPEDKVIMADKLTAQAMEDHTRPEAQAQGHLSRRFSTVEPLRLDPTSRPSMASLLSADASVDMTLPENIASPPSSRADSMSSYVSAAGRPSFGQIRRPRLSMSSALSEAILRDETTPEAQAAMSSAVGDGRRGSSGVHRFHEEPMALSPEDLRKRRQSFRLSEAAQKDATLIDNIEHPPAVSQAETGPVEESDLERLQRSRRPSSVAGAGARSP